jgi:hypothetical protein
MFHVLCETVEGHWMRVRRLRNRGPLYVIFETNCPENTRRILFSPRRAKSFFYKGLKLCSKIGLPKKSFLEFFQKGFQATYIVRDNYYCDRWVKLTKFQHGDKLMISMEMCNDLFMMSTANATILFQKGLEMCENTHPRVLLI